AVNAQLVAGDQALRHRHDEIGIGCGLKVGAIDEDAVMVVGRGDPMQGRPQLSASGRLDGDPASSIGVKYAGDDRIRHDKAGFGHAADVDRLRLWGEIHPVILESVDDGVLDDDVSHTVYKNAPAADTVPLDQEAVERHLGMRARAYGDADAAALHAD